MIKTLKNNLMGKKHLEHQTGYWPKTAPLCMVGLAMGKGRGGIVTGWDQK